LSFAPSFRTLTGHDPFPWQERLHRQFLAGAEALPRTVDVPTGLGKTNVMALWLLALGNAPLPRRLVYVVDRRAVVDQASAFAARLAEACPIGLDRPAVSTLRGSLADNRAWLEDPARAALVVGTVDMIGSRLLFSGYGVSRAMRPFHAGVLGMDTLVVLDEAHLSAPFEALLSSISRETAGGLRLMALSATGRAAPDFVLDEEDHAHPIVARRVHARKTVSFEARGEDPKAIAAQALALVRNGPARVAVFLTRRELARKVADALKADARVILLVGERRGRERDAVAGELAAAGFTGEAGPVSEPVFVVATSAGEVGIDLDADHMVADLVAFERMAQRLGRVNRRGGRDEARVVVLDIATKDAAEAARRAETRALLERLPAPDGAPIASPAALSALRAADPVAIARASTPPPLHPPLTRPLVEAWAMTALADHTGRPEVGPWLRGWVEDGPQTVVVWRAHLPVLRATDPAGGEDDQVIESDVAAFFAEAPPHVSEKLEAETSHVVDWLFEKRAALQKGRQHLLGSLTQGSVVALVLSGALELRRPITLQELLAERLTKQGLQRQLAGASLVVDSRFGGLSHGLLVASEPNAPVTADDGIDNPDWPQLVGFRVERHAPQARPEGRVALSIPVERNAGGDVVSVLSVLALSGASEGEDGRSVSRRPVTLESHTARVVAKAAALLDRLPLPSEEAEAIRIAAELHDLGKAAPVWQHAMRAPAEGGPYAKTRGGNGHALLGYRHEFGSLLAAETHPGLAALSPEMRDLALHLVAAHHGRARPILPADGCEDGPPSDLAAKAGEAARRYARLSARYGAWGLAYREAILRAADQAASREEATDGAE
jgi:CRISPR-associated endonuclease/helicase Cas3